MTDQTTKLERDMADHLQLAKTLAHHDAAISGLGTRMTGVETGLSHVNEKVSTLDSRVAQGFGEVLSQIREGKASQGPGLSETMKIVMSGATLVALACAAVTFLVTSHVEPKIQKLTDTADMLSAENIRARDAKERELEALKELRRKMIDERLEKLVEAPPPIPSPAGDWGTIVIERGAKK